MPPSVEISHCTVGAGKPDAVASKTAFSPTSRVMLAGCCVTAGGTSTVSVAALLVALPAAFVNTARYSSPFSETVASAIVSLSEVAPSTSVHVLPLFVEISHCTLGVGNPEPAASKTALWPSSTVVLAGCSVTDGAFWTVSVAALLIASLGGVPSLKTARYSRPLLDVFSLGSVSLSDVAPATLLHVVPLSDRICHCTVGVGNPEAVASKTAVWPSSTVVLIGWAVT